MLNIFKRFRKEEVEEVVVVTDVTVIDKDGNEIVIDNNEEVIEEEVEEIVIDNEEELEENEEETIEEVEENEEETIEEVEENEEEAIDNNEEETFEEEVAMDNDEEAVEENNEKETIKERIEKQYKTYKENLVSKFNKFKITMKKLGVLVMMGMLVILYRIEKIFKKIETLVDNHIKKMEEKAEKICNKYEG